jgi:hypothetical protein
MRIWSLHPKYLDRQGLIALWREGLLAKKVLENKTKGYRNHPQLNRFKADSQPLKLINLYLHTVCDEGERRGYKFDRSKLSRIKSEVVKIHVTSGQMKYEWSHLLKKQAVRSREWYLMNRKVKRLRPHPTFRIVKGPISAWEIVS